MSQRIQIYLRVRPHPRQSALVDVAEERSKITFEVPRDPGAGYVNNTRQSDAFSFDRVFGPAVDQEEIYQQVMHQALLSTLDGYNSTVFAYGQTGSGKTWTITGGSKYSQRGLIPRTLSTVFSEVTKRSAEIYTVHVSYMEIYNETCYDLLDPNHEADTLEELPRVTLRTDENKELQFINLNRHLVTSEEAALNFVFLGDTNRTIAETPMNPMSSRSHCIFTLYIEARAEGDNTIRRSKLHLVDLAGSERVAKTGASGVRFQEAIHINKALHFLEQVIVSLQTRAGHVSYRNSKITQVLRDSLGGNCRTAMVATVSPTEESVPESVSTCKFAQRVACVSNKARINEELDPVLEIARLRREVETLRAQQAGEGSMEADDVALTEDTLARCKDMVDAYIEDRSPEAFLLVPRPRMGTECFRLFRNYLWAALEKAKQPCDAEAARLIAELRRRIAQRDREVSVLVSMLNARKNRTEAGTQTEALATPGQARLAGIMATAEARSGAAQAAAPATAAPLLLRAAPGALPSAPASASAATPAHVGEKESREEMARQFEQFRRGHPDNEVFMENSQLLREYYAQAKALGKEVNESKRRMVSLKAAVEQHRLERALRGALSSSGGNADEGDDGAARTVQPPPEEANLKKQMEQERSRYKQHMGQYSEVKKNTETLEVMLRKMRTSIRSDFEVWHNVMHRRTDLSMPAPAPALPHTAGNVGSPMQSQQGQQPLARSTSPPAPRRTVSAAWGSPGGLVGAAAAATALPPAPWSAAPVPVAATSAVQPPPTQSDSGPTSGAGGSSLAHSSSAPGTPSGPRVVPARAASAPSSDEAALQFSLAMSLAGTDSGLSRRSLGMDTSAGAAYAGGTRAELLARQPVKHQHRAAAAGASFQGAAGVGVGAGPVLTGIAEADEEIRSFYRLRDQMLEQRRSGSFSRSHGRQSRDRAPSRESDVVPSSYY